jgi:hypothetical protein
MRDPSNLILVPMKQDGLSSIWLCKLCRANFLFLSDVEEHTKRSGHTLIDEYDLSSGKLLNTIDS